MTNAGSIGENTITGHKTNRTRTFLGTWYSGYRNSEEHYKIMISAKYNYVGCSNLYYDKDNSSQFDIYLTSVELTPRH